MLDRLLRWLRIRRDPDWWRVTAERYNYTEWHELESHAAALRLAGVLVEEGYAVTVKPIDRSRVITGQEAHE